MAQTFSLAPEYEYVEDDIYRTQQNESEFGYVQTFALWPRPKRRFNLHWDAAFDAEMWTIRSFFRDHSGPASQFDYSPMDPIATPHQAGSAAEVTGGALSGRTYFYAISWVTASGETTTSPEASFAVAVNKLFKLTIPKFWYSTITKARVYVGTTTGILKLEAEVTTSAGSWTEPTTGLVGSGASPPTTNTARETVSVHLYEDSFSVSKNSPVSYSINLIFEELF